MRFRKRRKRAGRSHAVNGSDGARTTVNDKILIVDDDPAVHEVASAYLEHEGYIVYSAPESPS
jgi:PleD family two-component response regulator